MQASDDPGMSKATNADAGGGRASPGDPVALPGWAIKGLDYPTFRIGLLAKVMDRLTIRDLMDTDGLTYAEWRVLVRLAAVEDGGTPGRVAELAWADLGEVSRAIGSLERKGLVERHKNPGTSGPGAFRRSARSCTIPRPSSGWVGIRVPRNSGTASDRVRNCLRRRGGGRPFRR